MDSGICAQNCLCALKHQQEFKSVMFSIFLQRNTRRWGVCHSHPATGKRGKGKKTHLHSLWLAVASGCTHTGSETHTVHRQRVSERVWLEVSRGADEATEVKTEAVTLSGGFRGWERRNELPGRPSTLTYALSVCMSRWWHRNLCLRKLETDEAVLGLIDF